MRMWRRPPRPNELRIMAGGWILHFDYNPDLILSRSVKEQNGYLATQDLLGLPDLRWAADLRFLAARQEQAANDEDSTDLVADTDVGPRNETKRRKRGCCWITASIESPVYVVSPRPKYHIIMTKCEVFEITSLKMRQRIMRDSSDGAVVPDSRASASRLPSPGTNMISKQQAFY